MPNVEDTCFQHVGWLWLNQTYEKSDNFTESIWMYVYQTDSFIS